MFTFYFRNIFSLLLFDFLFNFEKINVKCLRLPIHKFSVSLHTTKVKRFHVSIHIGLRNKKKKKKVSLFGPFAIINIFDWDINSSGKDFKG